MKKLLCIFVLAVFGLGLSACTMKGDGVKYYDMAEPYEARIYMVLTADTEMLTAVGFLDFVNELQQYTAAAAGDDFENAVLTMDTANYTDNEDGTVTIPLNIKIDRVKPQEVTITSDFFYRYRTTVIFNPFTVLKKVDGVQYYFGLELKQRSTKVSNAIPTHENGKYQYIWYANHPQIAWDWQNSDLIFYDKFANTPAWYVTAIIISGIVGVIVYFACKKRTNKDIIV
jgi:hypothetical protein